MSDGNIPQGVVWRRSAWRRSARESERADRLFHDPYAGAFVDAAPDALMDAAPGALVDAAPEALVGAAPRATVPRQAPPGEPAALGAIFQARVAIRTRFYDDYLLAACAAGCRQAVLLAAGMDTRGYRLGWPAGTRLFEIDQLDVLALKHAVLTTRDAVPRCHRVAQSAESARPRRSASS